MYKEFSKGSFQEVNISEICNTVRSSNINVISSYTFGFPEYTLQTMQQTLELNTEMANMDPCKALPGRPIHRRALKKGRQLPDSCAGCAFPFVWLPAVGHKACERSRGPALSR